jgi:hypothetical protein
MESDKARWLVVLAGAEADLARLIEAQPGEDWQIVRHEEQGVILCGPRFDTQGGYESVGRIAERLISHINRTARWYLASDFQGASCAKIVDQSCGHTIVFLDSAVEIEVGGSALVTTTAPNGTVETSEDRAGRERVRNSPRLVALQEKHPDLGEALRYLDEEPSMYGFYKVGEAILCAIGKPKEWKALVKLGWTSDDELCRFTRSTHTKRHHRVAGPRKRMSLREAEAYVRGLLAKLMTHLDGPSP